MPGSRFTQRAGDAGEGEAEPRCNEAAGGLELIADDGVGADLANPVRGVTAEEVGLPREAADVAPGAAVAGQLAGGKGREGNAPSLHHRRRAGVMDEGRAVAARLELAGEHRERPHMAGERRAEEG